LLKDKQRVVSFEGVVIGKRFEPAGAVGP
jgi:hypothetical protein